MKQKGSISVPLKGMQRDNISSQLKPDSYILGVNINSSNENEGFVVQNEPSNYLAVDFPANYKVLIFKKDILKERTYYYLTSTDPDINSIHHKRSSIGYVEDNISETFNQDTECLDCNNPKNILGTPLELITQVPQKQYIELLNDRCISLADIETKGLNFDINFPIKKIEIKQEKLGTTLYWNDNRNYFRYLQVGRIEEALEKGTFDYLHTLDIACDDPIETSCLDVDKLLVSPKHTRIVLEADKEQTGGNLKQGTYEFWASYCDSYGNEITEYSTPTNPISIWDENNYIQSQTETDDFTNFAIKIKVHNLDRKRFKYYKIVAVERNNVNNTQSPFLAGIYPTTDDVIAYTHSSSTSPNITRGNVSIKTRMDMADLYAIKPQYKRMKGTMVSEDRLFGFGLEEEEEINLQPVVSLFSGLVKAQTSVANENLYKSSIATSKYKQYPRNEVQPLAIRLLYNDGGYSANFPFVGRPKNEDDATIIDDLNINKASLIAGESSCSENTRQEKWQIFNTATLLDSEDCFDLDANSISLPAEEVEKTCYVDIATEIPTDTITITDFEDFTSLEDYINNNPDLVIPEITPYLEDTYLETCVPLYVGDCNTPVLRASTLDDPNPINQIEEVVGEVVEYVYKTDGEYLKSLAPQVCSPFKRDANTGALIEDEDIDDTLLICSGSTRQKAYLRDSSFSNEICAYATSLPLQTDPTQSPYSTFFNYDASDTLADLLLDNATFTTTVTAAGFYSNLHNKAQFFGVKREGRDEIVFEISKKSACISESDVFANLNNTSVRYVIYDDCTTPTELGGGIVDLTTGELVTLDVTGFPNDFIIAVDTKITTQSVPLDCIDLMTLRSVYYVTPPCGCFGIYQRNVEAKSITVTWDSIKLRKKIDYVANCTFTIPKVNDCDPIPYKKYKMAYWESTIEYPDNKQLYDSSVLKIRPADLSILEIDDKTDFVNYYTDGIDINGVYNLKSTTDLRCQPIRHPKLPDNTIAPFMLDNLSHKEGADSIIFPMGINLDSKIVQTMIEVAYFNNLITKAQKEKIVGWEILKGDNSIHKSITASGILYDVYKYVKKGEEIHFSNFPFNDLGSNKFVKDPTTKQLIKHPFNGSSNNKFTFLSPDMFLTKPAIPTEMSLQGYMFGNAEMSFADVKDHPKWTVLGDNSYKTAGTLAIAEILLEGLIEANRIIGNTWFVAGVGSTGSNIGGVSVATGVFLALSTLGEAFVKYGQYRYNWLNIFRNLGRADNFASFQFGAGKHNRFLKLENEDDNYLRKLAIKKHLRDGNYTLTDENDGSTTKFNHHLRENSVFLSTGDYSINYPDEYKNFDNNILNVKTSSNFLSSEVTASNPRRNIGNPYIYLKNYIPDQWDTLDSIKWLTTNYIFDLQEDTTCKVIYGGSQVISRFSWRVKVPLFLDNAIKLADKLPYLYSRNSNIGDTTYYCNYETADDTTFTKFGTVFPDIRSEYKFDEETGKSNFYLRPPSKFYLYTHGVVDFLVESEINCNFRYGKKDPKDQFYKNQNLQEWLQEVNLPIVEPNTFYYNNTYSFPTSNTIYKKLDRDYDKEIWRKRALKPNAWVWSEKDMDENSLIDPYLVFKPLNFLEEGTDNGKLIDLRSIESNQFLGRYENTFQLFNPANAVADAINKQTGTGFLQSRPITFKKADLGFAGTQHTEFVSTPYGHFWVDAKRGRIFQVDQNGGNMEVISESIQGQPSGMKQWFREHLPFKILKQFPNIDIDNKFKGLGLNMWYDSRNDRLFITKRDYIAINTENLEYEDGLGFYIQDSLPDITCPEGYTYNELTDSCELVEISSSCPIGFTYNTLTNMCEQTNTCEEGLDIVFILDATASQQDSIDNIKAAIATTIVPAIISNFGANYRLGLVSVKDRRVDGQALFDILEPMTLANQISFTTQINTIVAEGGTGVEEPTDLAIQAVLNNTQAIDRDGDLLGGNTIGAFRAGASKAIILVTDNLPSGLNDDYDDTDWISANAMAIQSNLQGIQIFSYLTSPTEPVAEPPIPMVQFANVTYIMQNYATVTNGTYYFTPSGVGVSDGVVDAIVGGIVCPPPTEIEPSCEIGCTEELENCICILTEEPIRGGIKTPIYFDNTDYFKDVSWTISYKPTEGAWNSYFTFYPDFCNSSQEYFQTGFNWGEDKETLWSHPMNNDSFTVFQGRYNPWILEFPIANDNTNKILNNLSINIEAKRYLNHYDDVVQPNVGVTDLMIYNSRNNSGKLALHAQKTLVDDRKYPYLEGGKQHILTTFTNGEQHINYFYNRLLNENSNVPMFQRDENNILKDVDTRIVKFSGKKVLERLSGKNFIVQLSNTLDSRYNITIKNIISGETTTD